MCVTREMTHLFWETPDNAHDATKVNQNAELEEASEATERCAPVKEGSENIQSPSGAPRGFA